MAGYHRKKREFMRLKVEGEEGAVVVPIKTIYAPQIHHANRSKKHGAYV